MSLKRQKEELNNNHVVSGLGSNCCDKIPPVCTELDCAQNAFTYIVLFDSHNSPVK